MIVIDFHIHKFNRDNFQTLITFATKFE